MYQIFAVIATLLIFYRIIKRLHGEDWNQDNCTCFPEGCWSDCCWVHDHDCILALENLSPKMRLIADRKLFKCVYAKNKIVACIMYFGVRIWAYTYWWIGYWRETHEQRNP